MKMMTTDGQMNDGNNNSRFICGVIEGFYGKPWSFEQRKDLFKRLKELKMNSFLYAPKDDVKHRAKWRQLYSDEEARHLRELIEEAKRNGIDFYYSLAPGLDMVYSDENELNLLIQKYDQILALGCESFAILFDDIEPSIIDDRDRSVFKTYARAQVSVTNMIYLHLKEPKFLFCPTEYCESRAVPNVQNSSYLDTLGTGLMQNIDFMWSGSRVISKLITSDSIETLTKVIRRPPLIWENLHANDYDKKRVFLGPYSGRSTDIIPKIRGILTNPNCEYEANYIAIHTLAQWSRCTGDINLNNCCNSNQLTQDDLLLARDTSNSTSPFSAPADRVYNPHKALRLAISDWLPHILSDRSPPLGPNFRPNAERSDESASAQLTLDAGKTTQDEAEEGSVEMVPEECRSSAASSGTNKSSGEMDTCSSPAGNSVIEREANTCDSCDMQDSSEPPTSEPATTSSGGGPAQQHQQMIVGGPDSDPQRGDTVGGQVASNATCVDCVMCSMGVSQSGDPIADRVAEESRLAGTLNSDSLSLLIDLFYLPFEHGFYGYSLLKDIKWLKDNSDILIAHNNGKGSSAPQDRVGDEHHCKENSMIEDNQEDSSLNVVVDSNDATKREEVSVAVWLDRAEKLNNLCLCINQLVNSLIFNCPNKFLIIELFPYLADLQETTKLIIDYVKFLRYRISALDSFYYAHGSANKQPKEIASDEQEPWVHRGGLIGDVQRLLAT